MKNPSTVMFNPNNSVVIVKPVPLFRNPNGSIMFKPYYSNPDNSFMLSPKS